MNRLKISSMLLTGLLALTLNAQAAFAGPAIKRKLEPVSPDRAGIEFKVAYENGAYAVYMRPNVTPEGLNLTLTSQVTIKVPHAADADRFAVSNLQSAVAGTEWAQSSRVDAPAKMVTLTTSRSRSISPMATIVSISGLRARRSSSSPLPMGGLVWAPSA